MYRTLALAASVAVLCTPAFAGDISISLAGKTKAQVIAEIRNAAASVCAQEGYTHLDQRMTCMTEAEHEAVSQLSAAPKPTKVG
ncbi:MAG TPA: hypothetical protein VMU59_08230 [Caulobacteraceae bacterium]|nr:hypothetical protein [Caulobacteraceae bacterium]